MACLFRWKLFFAVLAIATAVIIDIIYNILNNTDAITEIQTPWKDRYYVPIVGVSFSGT